MSNTSRHSNYKRSVILLRKLRDEVKFPSLESLRKQIEADAVEAMAEARKAGASVNEN